MNEKAMQQLVDAYCEIDALKKTNEELRSSMFAMQSLMASTVADSDRMKAEFNGRFLRDRFAMAALTGLCSIPPNNFGDTCKQDAEYCYRIADAMLKARDMGREGE